jgi:hypothetical protein
LSATRGRFKDATEVATTRAEAKVSARTLISEFESGQQSFRQFAGMVLRMGWFNRGSNPHSADNRSNGWKGEKSLNGSRQ